MRRWVESRCLAVILALSVLFASGVTLPQRAYAAQGFESKSFSDASGGSQAAGDPDGTAGPCAGSRGVLPAARGGSAGVVPSVADRGTALRVWMWRFHVVLLSLRTRGLRI